MMNLLWLPAWYPNRIEPYTGDFLQRHAAAVSLFHRVRVIHVLRDKDGIVTRQVHREDRASGSLKETVIYYYSPSFAIKPFEKWWSSLRYRRLYRQAILEYIREEGLPAAVHVQIAGKNGWMALWLKRRYGIPFFVSDQWTGYLPEARPGFGQQSWSLRRLWQLVMKKAAGVSVVSQYLGNAMAALRPGLTFSVIPNVVDNRLFYPAAVNTASDIPRFIHISTLGYQKNPEAIFHALALVKQAGGRFQLSVFGQPAPALQQLVAELDLQQEIQFLSEVPQNILADHMRTADALILYSRYETFGCVLIEANACGLPAIVSDIPVHHETIEEGVNGYFAKGEHAEDLARVISRFLHEKNTADKAAISAAAYRKYNYERVGAMFDAFYAAHLGKKV